MSGVHVSITNYLNLPPDDFVEICVDIVNRLIDATPVDTGYCVEHWRYTVISEDLVEIWNDTEYLSYLEDGWSNQASAGWIEDILSNFSVIVYDYYNS